MALEIAQPYDIGTKIHTNSDGDVTFERVQDCSAIVEDAVSRHNEGIHGSSEMKHAARVPFVIVERYLNDNNITLRDFMTSTDHQKRILNDPSLAAFRIWKGRV